VWLLLAATVVQVTIQAMYVGEISGVCERSEGHGVDRNGRIPLLAHALVGSTQ